MSTGDLESRFSTIIPRVEFLNVQDQYSYNEDLICKYYLIDYEVQEGDRVAIFKLGWQYIKDYILFEWAAKDSETNVVIFNKPCLPKSTSEIYQFCFISSENNVLGASEPFQLSDKTKNYHQSLFKSSIFKLDHSMPDDYKSLSNASPSPINNIPDIIERDREMLRLKEENEFLRSTLKILIGKQMAKKCDGDIQDLKKMITDIQLTVVNQQNQIKDLQSHVARCDSNYKSVQIEKDNLEGRCDDLKKRYQDVNISTDDEFGELESLPPFPFAK